MTNLDTVKTALLTVTQKCYHYSAPQNVTGPYIVWAEDNQADSVWADGKMQEQAIEGTVDYFTKTENDSDVQSIQNALNDAGVSFRLNSIQYETDTGYIHYEWTFQVEGF